MNNLLPLDSEPTLKANTLKKDIEFETADHKRYRLTIYDDGMYCIKHPCVHSFKQVKNFLCGNSDDEFYQIDPSFKAWLMAQLKLFYEM